MIGRNWNMVSFSIENALYVRFTSSYRKIAGTAARHL